jgi:hypothetical protein
LALKPSDFCNVRVNPYRHRIALKVIRVIRVICVICGLKS